mmetsp:Transcript_56395/g.132256  ORF Transcript_56395/g.132256 Transcript_56395/m.132256 type:complete len:317 (-) Transcript_56395:292-1242(-)
MCPNHIKQAVISAIFTIMRHPSDNRASMNLYTTFITRSIRTTPMRWMNLTSFTIRNSLDRFAFESTLSSKNIRGMTYTISPTKQVKSKKNHVRMYLAAIFFSLISALPSAVWYPVVKLKPMSIDQNTELKSAIRTATSTGITVSQVNENGMYTKSNMSTAMLRSSKPKRKLDSGLKIARHPFCAQKSVLQVLLKVLSKILDGTVNLNDVPKPAPGNASSSSAPYACRSDMSTHSFRNAMLDGHPATGEGLLSVLFFSTTFVVNAPSNFSEFSSLPRPLIESIFCSAISKDDFVTSFGVVAMVCMPSANSEVSSEHP